MKIQLTRKTGFICKSLLWSLLLYACSVCIFNWQDIKSVFAKKESNPMVIAGHSSDDIPAIRIAVDSLQRQINIAEDVISYLRALLPRQ